MLINFLKSNINIILIFILLNWSQTNSQSISENNCREGDVVIEYDSSFTVNGEVLFDFDISKDDTYLATFPMSGSGEIWSLKSYSKILSIKKDGYARFGCVAINSGLNVVAYGDLQGRIIFYSLEDGQPLKGLNTYSQVNGIQFLNNEINMLVVNSWSSISEHKLDDQSEREICYHPNLKSFKIDYDSKYLATGDANGAIKIWSIANSQLVKTINAFNDEVWALEFSHDNNYLISSSNKGIIKIWNMPNMQLINEIQAHRSQIKAISSHKDNQFFATGSHDKLIKIWTYKATTPSITLEVSDIILSLRFNNNGDKLISCSPDNVVNIYSVK